MELRQLKYFVAVAEEGNFTRAAERVQISQPGISAQIRQLEHELGATLIDRSGRAAALTPAGREVLLHARAVLAAAESLQQAVDEVNGLIRGRLVVGMVTACTITPLFDALSTFHLAHPGVEITLMEGASAQLVEHVRTGKADLALIGAAGRPPDDLDSWPIMSEPIVAAVPLGHPLCGQRAITMAELAGYPIICLPEGTGIRAVFEQAAGRLSVRPNIALQASAPASVATLALRGLGVAVLSASMIDQYEGLEPIAISDVDVAAVLALVSARTKSPALRELLAHCRRSFGEPRLPDAAGDRRTGS